MRPFRWFPVVLTALCISAPAAAQESIRDFQLSGTAAPLGDDCIRLTPDQPYVSGSAWYNEPIDLRKPFEMRMSLVLGSKDLTGADGIVFVFHPSVQTGFRGEGMGFAGLVPSLGIEFDTYENLHLSDPASDHLALMLNGRSYHGPDTRPVELGNLEDGARHPVNIQWTPGKQLKIIVDGVVRARYGAATVEAVFGSTPVVYWGMTAGTGRLSNPQDVCIDKLLLGASDLPRRRVSSLHVDSVADGTGL